MSEEEKEVIGVDFEEMTEEQPCSPPDEVVAEPEEVPVDPVEAFDVTSRMRQEALEKVDQVLLRASGGSKISRGDVVKALRSLRQVNGALDEVIRNLMGDMFKTIRAIASAEANAFQQGAQLMTTVEALKEKGVLDSEDFSRVYNEKVLPMLSEQMGVDTSMPEEPGDADEEILFDDDDLEEENIQEDDTTEVA